MMATSPPSRPSHPQPPSDSRQSLLHDITHGAHFGRDIDFVVGITAIALAGDQLLKFKGSREHKKAHLAKAGLSVAAAAAAFTMMRHEHHEQRHINRRGSSGRKPVRHRSYDYDIQSDNHNDPFRPRSRSLERSLHAREARDDYRFPVGPALASPTRQSTHGPAHPHPPVPYPDDDDDDNYRYTRPAERLRLTSQQRERRTRSLSPSSHYRCG